MTLDSWMMPLILKKSFGRLKPVIAVYAANPAESICAQRFYIYRNPIRLITAG